MIKRLTPMQWKTLSMIHKGRGEPKGCRAETIGALVDAGYIRVHATETEEQFRPSRSWSPVRWTRRRTEVHVIGLTPAGIEALAAHEAKMGPTSRGHSSGSSRSADHVYRNVTDTIRFSIHRYGNRSEGAGREWNIHIFHRNGNVVSYADEAGDVFRTKAAALAEIRRVYGKVLPINPQGRVTEGW